MKKQTFDVRVLGFLSFTALMMGLLICSDLQKVLLVYLALKELSSPLTSLLSTRSSHKSRIKSTQRRKHY